MRVEINEIESDEENQQNQKLLSEKFKVSYFGPRFPPGHTKQHGQRPLLVLLGHLPLWGLERPPSKPGFPTAPPSSLHPGARRRLAALWRGYSS